MEKIPSSSKKTKDYKHLISDILQRIRENHHLTQKELAEKIEISQPKLSSIEKGRASLSAEQLLHLLTSFEVPVSELNLTSNLSPLNHIQTQLSHFKSKYLEYPQKPLSSLELYDIQALFQEILVISPSPEFILELTPLIPHYMGQLNPDAIASRLYDLGIDGRLWWLMEGVLWGIRQRLRWFLPRKLIQYYKKAEFVLGLKSRSANFFFSNRKGYSNDYVGLDLVSEQKLEALKGERDALATRWRLFTRIRAEDFAKALENAEDGLLKIL